MDNYSNYIYTISMRYVKDADVAKDCLQESLIQIFRKIHLYEERGKFRAWISAVTVKKCLDVIRKEKRHIYSEIDAVPEPGYREQVSLKMEQEDVMRFLATLPDSYRIALNMFLVEGYNHKEIGAHLGVTESSSRSLVSRARKMIVKAFESEKTKVSMLEARTNEMKDFTIKMINS